MGDDITSKTESKADEGKSQKKMHKTENLDKRVKSRKVEHLFNCRASGEER